MKAYVCLHDAVVTGVFVWRCVQVHQYDIVMDVTVINRTAETLQVCGELLHT